MSAAAGAALAGKYDIAAPRYTSYPTVPFWEHTPSATQWCDHLGRALDRDGAPGAALYLHIPFCRQLCTFCGCNTRITRSHEFVRPYVQALLAELDLYRRALGRERLGIGELHLGGGTPTFLTAGELAELLDGLAQRTQRLPGAACSVEVDPRVTDRGQLELLARHGFRRISLGVQDFDPRVQAIVNRVQSEHCVVEVTDAARASGFESVNFDLIYGLPLQTPAGFDATMETVCRLRPDRIALYGYAHVPWIRPGQRRFTDQDLPPGELRRELRDRARARLERDGYREIGLDHFALESDRLYTAQHDGSLHRNFMGYTDRCAQPLIGLGVSAIGDAGDAFAQNEKELRAYQRRVAAGELPILRGHLLDAEDRILRAHILSLMTRLQTRWDAPERRTAWLEGVPERLAGLAADGLVELEAASCRVTARGRPFLRNVCVAFDARLARRAPGQALFSRSG